jgi:C-terminal processing protease CtpA/Prc
VDPHGPAALAGTKIGDQLISVNGTTLEEVGLELAWGCLRGHECCHVVIPRASSDVDPRLQEGAMCAAPMGKSSRCPDEA